MATKETDETTKKSSPIDCGIVMPISAQDNCSADHWGEVQEILKEAIDSIAEPKFSGKLVSDSDEVGVIQKRIVQNLYSLDIVVCDVSARNANVMFELGMRLAFDKPTVIIKDDKTDYSFDTGIIEHITYPRDLRFSKIVEFKSKLAEKVLATYLVSKKNPEHSPFLKNFGKFQVAQISEDVIPADKMILEMLQDMQMDIARLRRSSSISNSRLKRDPVFALKEGLIKYMELKNVDNPVRLLGEDSFYSEMEEICDAPKHFDSPTEFRRELEKYIIENYRNLTSRST